MKTFVILVLIACSTTLYAQKTDISQVNTSQSHELEPFLSQFVFRQLWRNSYIEICNPDNHSIDLSDYMIVFTDDGLLSPITNFSCVDCFDQRYNKYVTGYKWVDSTDWGQSPGILIKDTTIHPIVSAGDVFVIGDIDEAFSYPEYSELHRDLCDVNIRNYYNQIDGSRHSAVQGWYSQTWYMFKILNDSIKQGLKPADDPRDFELIEVFGNGDETQWVIGGVPADNATSYVRKSDYTRGNSIYGGSFGTDTLNSEWTWTNREYWMDQGYSWPLDVLMVTDGLGEHSFNIHVPSTTFALGEIDCFNATNEITVAGDSSNVVIEHGATAEFIAGQSIRFLPGFHAQEGSYVNATITTNGTFCDGYSPQPNMLAAEVTEENPVKSAGIATRKEQGVQRAGIMAAYPNPNNGEFSVMFDNNNQKIRVMMINGMGQMVYNRETTENQIQLNMHHLESGIYFIKAINSEQYFSQKIIIQ
jgi:hypothetical protein